MNIVGRLCGFHTTMSFMGSIGSMVKASGQEDALETVHGPNAVAHMISGNAVSRVLYGHFVVEATSVNKLMWHINYAKSSRLYLQLCGNCQLIFHGCIKASPNKGFILSVEVADTGLDCGLTYH